MTYMHVVSCKVPLRVLAGGPSTAIRAVDATADIRIGCTLNTSQRFSALTDDQCKQVRLGMQGRFHMQLHREACKLNIDYLVTSL
jgi:hypothetical protein